MKNQKSRTVWITNENGERLRITMQNEGGKLLGTLFINQIPYHTFFARKDEISHGGRYVLDDDPDYHPKSTSSGKYLIIAPYSI